MEFLNIQKQEKDFNKSHSYQTNELDEEYKKVSQEMSLHELSSSKELTKLKGAIEKQWLEFEQKMSEIQDQELEASTLMNDKYTKRLSELFDELQSLTSQME